MNELPKRGDLIAGKYQVEAILGQGGMGAVFEVSHRLTGKHFAVKWLLPSLSGQADAVRRFMREAQVAGRVDHPNVVEVYDVGQEGSSFFMVMELLQGEPLSKRLDRVHRLSLEETCKILLPVMHGLTVAHAAGVIHRDLKPDNIFLCRTPLDTEVPKVLDFGISKMSPLAGELSANVTRAGLVIGTPHYMSPEQLKGEPVDTRTDVFALGVMIYEMLGGALPFPGDSLADVILTIVHEQPKPLAQLAPGLPPGVVALVTKAIARDANARFASVEEMGRALAKFANGIEFGADTGDPTRASTAQRRALSAQRLRTPFSTEMEQRPALPLSGSGDGFPRQSQAALPMVAGVGIAALAVAALAAAAYLLASPKPDATLLPTVSPAGQPAIQDSNGRAPSDAPAHADNGVDNGVKDLPRGVDGRSSDELPTPSTVHIGPDLPDDRLLQSPQSNGRARGSVPQGAYDPAGLGASAGPTDSDAIRLSGRRSASPYATSNAGTRDSSRRERVAKRRAERRAERTEDPPAPDRADSTNDSADTGERDDRPHRFRATDRPEGLTPEEF